MSYIIIGVTGLVMFSVFINIIAVVYRILRNEKN
tara:strand:+ start:381 stop:482 length:102 start_codon:yes stop_codon:yes gene_type:complete